MPYSFSITPFDFGNFFSSVPPTITGRFATSAGGVADRVGPVAGLTPLTFPILPNPPAGPATMHLGDTASGGDLYRSGTQPGWPAQPATLTLYTLPTATGSTALPGIGTSFSNAQLVSLVSGAASAPLAIPAGVQAGAAAVTGFMFVPTTLTITSVTSGTAPLSFNIVGTMTFRQLLWVRSTRVTATIALTAAPSGDAADLRRILAVTVASFAMDPGFITPGISMAIGLLSPVIGPLFGGTVEAELNKAIRNVVDTALAGGNPVRRLSPTASICARRVTATAAGVSIQAVVSDLFSDPLVTVPRPQPVGTLAVTITPRPEAGVQRLYAIQVRDGAGNPVEGASVQLSNLTSRGAATTDTRTTDIAGTASFDVALRARWQSRIVIGPGGRRETERTLRAPVLKVTRAGFSPVEMVLLDEDDVR